MIICSSDLLEVNFCFCAVVLCLMLAECPTLAPLVAYRSPLVFLPVFILEFIPSHFFSSLRKLTLRTSFFFQLYQVLLYRVLYTNKLSSDFNGLCLAECV